MLAELEPGAVRGPLDAVAEFPPLDIQTGEQYSPDVEGNEDPQELLATRSRVRSMTPCA